MPKSSYTKNYNASLDPPWMHTSVHWCVRVPVKLLGGYVVVRTQVCASATSASPYAQLQKEHKERCCQLSERTLHYECALILNSPILCNELVTQKSLIHYTISSASFDSLKWKDFLKKRASYDPLVHYFLRCLI